MAGYIEDRWYKKGPDGKRSIPTDLHGKGKRYKVTGIPGVRSRSFPDRQKKAAEAWLAQALAETAKGEFYDPRDGRMSLSEYVEQHWWPARTGDPATLRTVKGRVWNHILPHLGALPLNGIKTAQLRLWLKELDQAIGPSTIGEVWGELSSILQAAVDDERIPKNYCRSQRSVRPPAVPERKARAWSKERVLAVRQAMPDRFQLMVDLGVGAGLRQGEVLGLAVEDIDEEAQVLHVRRQVKKIGAKQVFALPKGQKTRTVPVPPYLLDAVREHLERFPAKKVTLPWGDPAPPATEREAKERAPRTFELITTSATGLAVRRDSWDNRVWKPALSAAGLIPPPETRKQPIRHRPGVSRTVVKYAEARELGFHALRHTFASVQLDAREPIVSVSRWLGHADPSITLRIYAHMMPEADGRGRAAMESWFARPVS
ncbi:tyrosine-type recombinase/integrase [Streptomyces longwoodensis]|uniref:tyrosine-type recombinase/integrase n=1 Tax=Streptomyces longwoodensis TaxID=68231 RepID=UPI0038258ADF